ncbi:hypothetical protein M728_000342 [Ensifer sp. WSM1721]|uniref:hypothetical protein n=1 Tax=Ensifer sp. WSM1721 TaxID=1041159 RepID=UPI00047A65B1|nr:hypothetical protein [Ensifer sp. WSM1721]
MSHPQASPQQKRLDAIRNRVALAAKDWGVTASDTFCLTAGQGEIIATFEKTAGFDDCELICHAPDDLRWLLSAYDALVRRYRELTRGMARPGPQQRQPNKDYAAECAMKCAEPAFKKFLEECHGLARPLTDDRVAIKVRSILNIRSRAELNDDAAAAARWHDLRSAFDAWRRQG